MFQTKPYAYKNTTASVKVKAGKGSIAGVFVASASNTPTLAFNDGITDTAAAGVKATQVLTGTDVFTDGETITVGWANGGDVVRKYTMRTTLSSPAQPYEVLIGVSLAVSLDNLKLAINAGAGSGTLYSTGTLVHPQVTATTNTNTQQTVEAVSVGVWGNSIATTETCANASWGAATCTGGLEPVVLLVNTFTPVAATFYKIPAVLNNGLYVVVGGTVDCTVFYN